MTFTSIDTIVRRTLLEQGLPIHYYMEYLFHATSCLRQLNIDTLKIINSALLPVNSYYAVDLPSDFMDDLAVTIPVGNLLHPVPKNNGLTPLRAIGSTGTYIPYSDIDNADAGTFFGFNASWMWFWNVNDYGEPTGRYFGSNGGGNANGYKLVKERNQIQLTETFTSDNIVLLYISDGQSADNATQVDPMAIDAIQAYIRWGASQNSGIDMSPEGAAYYNQRRILRARLNDLTTTDIKQIIHKAYTAAMKN